MALSCPAERAALVTMQSWMFLATYRGFPEAILDGWTLCAARFISAQAISGDQR